MPDVELILALMVAVAIIATAARSWRVPYPILLVLGGLVLALTPGVPNVTLAPDLIFLLFLPPLIYIAGFQTSPRDIKAQLRPILSLAVGLVLASALVVGVVAHALVPEFGWAVAFALGGILAATDAVAATALMRDLGAPRRVVTLVESESLFNDATALVAYQVALGAAAADTFSFTEAGLRILVAAVGGILIGLAVGWGVIWLRKHINDAPVEITISLLTPFAAYLPAEHLGLSGVLASATAGVLVGWYAPRIMSSDTRLRGRAVWDFLVFALNGLAFILVGLQLSTVLEQRPLRSLTELIAITAIIAATVIVVRFAWIFSAAALGLVLRRLKQQPAPSEVIWRESTVVSWAGLRGVVSLAAALALPLALTGRNVLLFITFGVILVTLVGQGLTLPAVIRLLRLRGDDAAEHDENHARTIAAEAAVARIDELARQWPGHLPLIDTLRSQYSHRATHLGEAHGDGSENGTARDVAAEQELLEHRLIRREVIEAERNAVLRLRDRGAINDEAWRRVERDLDLEELRMEA